MEKIDVRQSCEYRWRISQMKTYLAILLAVVVLSFFGTLLGSLGAQTSQMAGEVFAWAFGVCVAVFCLPFVPVVLYSWLMVRYLVNNHGKFLLFEAKLEHPSTSFSYKRAIYYSVTVKSGRTSFRADTNPLFSNAGVCPLEEYNNARVRLWYDEEKGKAYVIDKV